MARPSPTSAKARYWSKHWRICAVAGLIAAFGVILLATYERSEPERCPPGLIAHGPRCCGVGQVDDALNDMRQCRGTPKTCSSAQNAEPEGCSVVPSLVRLPAGRFEISVDDWDLQDRVRAAELRSVDAFGIDRFEVTGRQWTECAAAGVCDARQAPDQNLPVTNVSAAAASRYCAFRGGHLPTSSEWLWAARGVQDRRYPWGAFGLVCRRAVFGLVAGPCASGAVGPEVPGSRPDGATPEGVHDLSGNVAEWTLDAPSGPPIARGGSYRSTLAPELKTLASEEARTAAADIGFRCAYAL